jgi:phosphohistidine phosphatase
MQSSEGPHLWVVRHGRAEPNSPSGQDSDRSLDSLGRRQAAWLGRILATEHTRPHFILASPAARTWTTARLIGRAVEVEPQLDGLLTCEHAVAHALKATQRAFKECGTAESASFVVVGHNPTLSDLVSWLVNGIGPTGINLRTGEAALIRLDPDALLTRPGTAELETCRRMGDEAPVRTR